MGLYHGLINICPLSSIVRKLDYHYLDKIVTEMLVIINIVAIIPVAFDKKLLADLEDTKLSWEAPNPKAPPSDFCIRTTTTNKKADIIFINNISF